MIATIVVLGEGVVWYSSQFWALFYLQTVSKVDTLTTSFIVGLGFVIGTPSLIFFGWLSDKIGRKPVILGGFFLAAVTYYPLYTWLGSFSQPGHVNYADRDPHRRDHGLLRRHGVRAVRRVPCRILPRPHPLHGGVHAVLIGNGWGGGLVPFITTAVYTATGSPAYALIYPIAVPAVCLVLSLFLMPETRKMSVWDDDEKAFAKS